LSSLFFIVENVNFPRETHGKKHEEKYPLVAKVMEIYLFPFETSDAEENIFLLDVRRLFIAVLSSHRTR
jgi:hypothetical protein